MLSALTSNSNRLLKWLILLALVLFVTAIGIFLFGRPSFTESKVVLRLEGPTQAAVGDEITYKVVYGNDNQSELRDLKFRFVYPEGSVIVRDGKVVNTLSEEFEVEDLGTGARGEKELKAFLTGDRGNVRMARVEMSFRAGSLRAPFEKTADLSTTLISVPVSMNLAAPPSPVAGQNINYIFDYRNESGQDIADVRFEFEFPQGFTVRETSPNPAEPGVWTLPALNRGQAGRITVTGTLDGREGEVKAVSVSMKRRVNGEYVTYQKTTTSSVISNPLLSLELLVNNSRDYTAHLRDRLEYMLRYRNNSSSNIIGLNLQLKLEGEMYDFSNMDTQGGFFDASSGTVLWNAGSVPDFATLLPGRSGEVKFRISLKDRFPGGAAGGNFSVKASSRLTTPNVPSGQPGTEISVGSELVTRISTQPSFTQTMYYNDPAFGSSGPLPLQVGQETVFTVHWEVINPGNSMEQSQIKAILPPGINWLNVVSTGAGQAMPTYNPNSSEVSWNIGLLPQGAGVTSAEYEATFQVSIRPSTAGQVPLIIREAALSGIDSFTRENISVTSGALDAGQVVDRPGQGTVQ